MLMGLSVGRKEERMGVPLLSVVRGLEQPICMTEDSFLNLSRTITMNVVKMEKYPIKTKQYICIACSLGCLRGQKDVSRGLIMHDMLMLFHCGLPSTHTRDQEAVVQSTHSWRRW